MEAETMNWIDAAGEKPEAERPVLVVFADNGRVRWARACWVPKHTCSGEYEGDDADYVEADDEYYWPEGWYEWNQCEETHWRLSQEVTHWTQVELPSNG